MESVEISFPDNKGNHLLIALDFCDNSYKQSSLQIPEEYTDIDIVDISIEKVYLDKPIDASVFFKMTSWLLTQFEKYNNAIFTYICSTDDLETNHNKIKPQEYRRDLFNILLRRVSDKQKFKIQDIIIGPKDYLTFGRAFYRDKHAPIIFIVVSHLQDKQKIYEQQDQE